MGDFMDSTLKHFNKGKAYGRQGKAPMRLNSQHSRLLACVLVYCRCFHFSLKTLGLVRVNGAYSTNLNPGPVKS